MALNGMLGIPNGQLIPIEVTISNLALSSQQQGLFIDPNFPALEVSKLSKGIAFIAQGGTTIIQVVVHSETFTNWPTNVSALLAQERQLYKLFLTLVTGQSMSMSFSEHQAVSMFVGTVPLIPNG